MNSLLHINAIVQNQENAINIIDINTLCVARSIIIRKRADGKYEILLAENPDGKRKGKKGKFEFLGGKVYDNLEDQKKFLSLNKKEKMIAIKAGAIAEMGEEGGIFIPEKQSRFLEVQNKDISSDPYKKHGMEITNIQTHFYVSLLGEGEFGDINVECIEQAGNDDNHKDVRWETIDSIDDIDAIKGLLGTNSHVNTEKIEKVIQETILMNQREINDILTQPGAEVEEQGMSPVDLSGKKEYILGGDLDQKNQALKNHYQSQFGVILNTKEVNNNIKDILSNYVIPHIRDIANKLGIYDTYELNLLEKIGQSIPQISNTQDLFMFFEQNRETKIGHAIIQRFFAYRHIKNLPYFAYIDGYIEDFQSQLVGLCNEKDGKFIINNFSGQKVELKLDSNSKALNRMASKITTKPYLNNENIKDVYRARFIVEEENDAKAVQTFLLKKLGGAQSQKISSWNLVKKENITNLNGDENRSEIKILGNFPIYENGEYLDNISIPVEIQIMTRSSYEQNESGAKHHSVYETIQTLVDESRGNHGIPKEVYLENIQNLSSQKTIQQSYPDAYKGKNTQQRLYNDILTRFNKYFFETRDNKYIPYQHIYRYLNESHLVHKQNEYFMDMCGKINELFNLNLTSLEWFVLFNEQETNEKALDEIFSVSGRDFSNMFSQLKQMKIGISPERIEYLESI